VLGLISLSKGAAAGATLLAVGAVLLPVAENWKRRPKDSFPLSYYPMFSMRRQRTVRLSCLVGVDGRGERRLLHYSLAGTGGFNQVRRQINHLIREGAAEKLCEVVAAKVARKRSRRYAGILTVMVVTGEFRLQDYYAGRREPLAEEVHASRPVDRGAAPPIWGDAA
jgi:hypothetical protein